MLSVVHAHGHWGPRKFWRKWRGHYAGDPKRVPNGRLESSAWRIDPKGPPVREEQCLQYPSCPHSGSQNGTRQQGQVLSSEGHKLECHYLASSGSVDSTGSPGSTASMGSMGSASSAGRNSISSDPAGGWKVTNLTNYVAGLRRTRLRGCPAGESVLSHLTEQIGPSRGITMEPCII